MYKCSEGNEQKRVCEVCNMKNKNRTKCPVL